MQRVRTMKTRCFAFKGVYAMLLLLISGAHIDVAGVHPASSTSVSPTWGVPRRTMDVASTAGLASNTAHIGAHWTSGTAQLVDSIDHSIFLRCPTLASPQGSRPVLSATAQLIPGSTEGARAAAAHQVSLSTSRVHTLVTTCDDVAAVASAAIATPVACLAGVPRLTRAATPLAAVGICTGNVPTQPTPYGHTGPMVLQAQAGGPPSFASSTGWGVGGQVASPTLRGAISAMSGVALTNVGLSGARVQSVIDETTGALWLRAEDDALRLGVALYGKNWNTILCNPHFSRALLNRSALGLENRWNALQKLFKEQQLLDQQRQPVNNLMPNPPTASAHYWGVSGSPARTNSSSSRLHALHIVRASETQPIPPLDKLRVGSRTGPRVLGGLGVGGGLKVASNTRQMATGW